MDREAREHIKRINAEEEFLLDIFVGRSLRRRFLRFLVRIEEMVNRLVAREADK